MAIENKKNHFIWIDYLRTICCVSIVLIHVIGNWYKCVDLKHLMYDRYFIDCVLLQPFIRFAVPIFIMISGYLLLNPNKKLDIEKIQKYIIKMSIILVIFGLTFCFIENFFNFGSSNIPKLITNSFINFIEGKSWEHMWYLYMLLGLYLITPILRLFVKHANHKTVNFTLLSLLIVSIIIPTINDIF